MENIDIPKKEIYKNIIKYLAYNYGIQPDETKKVFEYCVKQSPISSYFYINNNFREKVYNAKENKCECCGSKENLTIHHIRPKSRYPRLTYDISNIQILCKKCHQEIHKRIPIDTPEIIGNSDDLYRLKRLNMDETQTEINPNEKYKILFKDTDYDKIVSDRKIQKTYTSKQKFKKGEVLDVGFVDMMNKFKREEKIIIAKCIMRKYKDLTYTDAKSEGYNSLKEFKEDLKRNKKVKDKTNLYMYVFSHIKQGI